METLKKLEIEDSRKAKFRRVAIDSTIGQPSHCPAISFVHLEHVAHMHALALLLASNSYI